MTHHASLITHHSTTLTFHHRDCVEGLRSVVAPGSVDVVVTSPPYNLGIGYSAYDDTVPRAAYLDWTATWVEAVHAALAEAGSFFLNVGSKPSDPWVPFQVVEVVGRRFQLQNVIHWIKSIAILKEDIGNYPGLTGDVVVGHYKPINSRRFLNDCHEYLFHFTKSGKVPLDRLAIGVPYQDLSNIARWQKAGAGLHCRGNTWFLEDTSADQDARWLALLIDTEGSIHIERSGRSTSRPSASYRSIISITNTSRALLDRAREMIGAGIIYDREEACYGGFEKRRPLYILRLDEVVAAPLLARVYQHLIVKQKQAQVAMCLADLKRPTADSRRRLTEEEMKAREDLCSRMRRLNKGEDVDLTELPVPTLVSSLTNVLFAPYKTIQSRDRERPHPATFPPALPAMCLKLHGLDRIRLVCDPFSGLGNTALACARLGKSFVGFEIDGEYLAEAVERVRAAIEVSGDDAAKDRGKRANQPRRGD